MSYESPTELNFPQPLGVITFVFKQFHAFVEVLHIIEHCLQIGSTRKCNSHSRQPCHLALTKSSTCQVSKMSSWKIRYFSDPPRVIFFNACTPYNEEWLLVPLLHFKCAPTILVSSLVVFSLAPTFDNHQNKCWIL